ncbi:hypothetical protein [Maricaulis sp.]|uniref:hypothetical protein n=1 Tax=Maricaulis sp. TaxID=1486257 RepID=UPI00262A4476|nr:hypothetical protein [Maricaulis sp.]
MTENLQENSSVLAEIDLIAESREAPLTAAPRSQMTSESGAPDTGPAARRQSDRSGAWLVWTGNIFALLWIGAAGAFLVGYLGINSLESLTRFGFGQLTGLAVFALTPALLFAMCGLLAREIVRNARNTDRVEAAISRLAQPAAHAGQQIRTLADAVSGEVERINDSMDSALARLAAMEEVINHHAETLEQSAGDAHERTETLLSGLRKERLRLGEVSESLDDKAALIAAAISDQSKMVAAAAELAASQANDTEKRLLATVDTLNDASASMAERGQVVSARITDRIEHLRDLSDELKTRADGLDTAYDTHKAKLGETGEALRKEQEKIAAALDFHRAELDVMVTAARDGAEALSAATTDGASAFKDAVDDALTRSRELAGHVRRETDHAAREHESALARLVAAAQEAKTMSDVAIAAVEEQAERVADKVQQTNEAAFEAAQRSDQAFEQRIAEAEKLTSKAAQAADDAAESVRRRLEAVLASARAETQTVERQIDSMTERLGEMPELARTRAQEAADALRRGLEGLNAAALAAAEEAQEIDAAFQARIRQNYELLSDFMLRMGSVAGGRRVPDLGLNEVPSPLPRRNRAPEDLAGDAAPAVRAQAETPSRDEMNTGLTGVSDEDRGGAETRVGFPERDAPKPAAAASGPVTGRRSEPGWRWKDLLSSMPEDRDNNPRAANADDKGE